MLLGYNTNGFAHHRLADAARILAGIGYRSLALTLEHEQLDPPNRRGAARAIAMVKPILETTGLRLTLETGTRFLLDPMRKHQPTLVSRSTDDRRRRLEFLDAAVEIAASLGADSVSLWSGSADDEAAEGELFGRLEDGLTELLQRAEALDVRLSFEPEPDMFIDTMQKFERLYASLNHPKFGLTLDVGHVHCLQDGDVANHVRRWQDRLWNVHIEDMRRGVHEHLPFGEGGVDFSGVFKALRAVCYTGPIHVELPRQSHDAITVASQSYQFLCRHFP